MAAYPPPYVGHTPTQPKGHRRHYLPTSTLIARHHRTPYITAALSPTTHSTPPPFFGGSKKPFPLANEFVVRQALMRLHLHGTYSEVSEKATDPKVIKVFAKYVVKKTRRKFGAFCGEEKLFVRSNVESGPHSLQEANTGALRGGGRYPLKVVTILRQLVGGVLFDARFQRLPRQVRVEEV